MPRPPHLLLPLLLLASVACNHDLVKAPDAPDASTPTTPTPRPSPEDMQRHFARANALRDALIAGDLDQARPHARWLTDHATDDAPTAWTPHLTTLRANALLAHDATNLPAAARATAHMALACGHCHTALSATISFPRPPMSSTEDDPRGHMQRHAWATDRLWEGLVGPDDDAWSAGVAALGEPPLGVEADPDVFPPANAAHAEKVHTLGKQAAEATTPEARANTWADLITACAACHHDAPRK